MDLKAQRGKAAASTDVGLYDIKGVNAVTSIGPSRIRELVAAGKFPAPVIQMRRCTRWRRGDVHAWCDSPTL